jgi:hypothetical protein
MAWFTLVEHANGAMFDPLGQHVSGRRRAVSAADAVCPHLN